MIVAVAGNPSIDKLFEVDEFRAGQIHRPTAVRALPGGKGIHVAQVATALGAEAIVSGVLGRPRRPLGRGITRCARGRGPVCVDARARHDRACPSPIARRPAHRVLRGRQPLTEDEWEALESVVLPLLPRATWMTLAGSLTAWRARDGYARMIATRAWQGCPVRRSTREATRLAQTLGGARTSSKSTPTRPRSCSVARVDGPR